MDIAIQILIPGVEKPYQMGAWQQISVVISGASWPHITHQYYWHSGRSTLIESSQILVLRHGPRRPTIANTVTT
jgi:hypothetical protein